MYPFLILLGVGSILYGIKMLKTEKGEIIDRVDMPIELRSENKPEAIIGEVAADVLEKDITEEPIVDDGLISDEELIYFNRILEAELNKQEKQENKSKSIQIDEENKRKIIKGIEKGEYSIEEACNILGMEKGEVLLLKNIYKNY